jgi:hypothetical protein
MEYDWLATDAEGHLAVCSTAGYGEVPLSVLQAEDSDRALERRIHEIIMGLPITGEPAREGRGPGECVEFLEFGRRGVFVFDWHPSNRQYERIVRPMTPVAMNLASVSAVSFTAVDFRHRQTFRASEFSPSE